MSDPTVEARTAAGVARPTPVPAYLIGWIAGAAPALAMITVLWLYPAETTPFGIVGLGAYALALPVMLRRLGIPRDAGFVRFLLAAGLAFGVLSILTGWGNGLTDEGFTTPRFAGFLLAGHDPYTMPMTVAYTVYGRHVVSTSLYVYLPLLMFLQVPGVPYKFFALACWALTVLVVRRRHDMAVLLAQPYAMLLGASGYNDPVVLLLLTVGFVGVGGRRQKWAEWLSLGCKQFANAFVFLYYLVRRDWRGLAVSAGVSAAFVVPFLLWGGSAVVCPAVLANRGPWCPRTGGIQLLVNYPIWPVWIVAVFYVPALAGVRTFLGRHGGSARTSALVRVPFERLPSLTIVAISAAISGLSVYVVAQAVPTTAAAGAVAAVALGALATAGWTYAWGGPWRFEGRGGSDRTGSLRAFGLAQAVLLVVAVAAEVAAGTFGGSPLVAAAVGLSGGTVVSYAILLRAAVPVPVAVPGPDGA